MKAHADREALGKGLVRRRGGKNGGRGIVCRDAGCITARLDEIGLKFCGVDTAPLRMRRILRRRRDDLRPFLVEVDETLGDRVAFGGVGTKQLRFGASLKNRGELPTEVERVLYGDVHSLAGLCAVRVTSVAGDEDAWEAKLPDPQGRRRTGL